MPPKIICHMVSSIDGRLHPERWSASGPGTSRGLMHRQYEETAETFAADGWIVGRTTMAEMLSGKSARAPDQTATPAGLRDTFVGNRGGRNLAVVIDPQPCPMPAL